MGTKGYTVLETFVVIALITAVAVFFTVYTDGVRAKGRDAARVAAVQEIVKALALYNTGSGFYPASAETKLTGEDPVSRALVGGKFIPAMPVDPRRPNFEYTYRSNGASYQLTFCLETESIKGYGKGCDNKIIP